jgi:hypothetical protein
MLSVFRVSGRRLRPCENVRMALTLTEIWGRPVASDTMPNETTVKCPRCDQTYRLGSTDSEWNKIKDWLKLAETAVRRDHDAGHEAACFHSDGSILGKCPNAVGSRKEADGPMLVPISTARRVS